MINHFHLQLIEALKPALRVYTQSRDNQARQAVLTIQNKLIKLTKEPPYSVGNQALVKNLDKTNQLLQCHTDWLVSQYFHQAAYNPSMPIHLQELVASLIDLLPLLTWYKRLTPASHQPSTFDQGHGNAYIIGSKKEGSLIESQDIAVGLSLMAPQVTYIDHQHPPEELYIILSPGLWRQKQNAWHAPGLGGYVYNPPNIIHAMRSGNLPLLALWCLNLSM